MILETQISQHKEHSLSASQANNSREPADIQAIEKIPFSYKTMGDLNPREPNIVKIYHEMTDDFGKVLRDSKTFNLKDSQA